MVLNEYMVAEGGGLPSLRRILQDYKKALRVFGVLEYGGRMVPEVTNRNDHCNHATCRNTTGFRDTRGKSHLVAELD